MKYFTYWHRGNIPESYKNIVNQNKQLIDLEEYYESEFELISRDNIDPRIPSDEFRFKFLQKNPSYGYIDQDTKLVKPIDFKMESNKVYIYNVQGDWTLTYGSGCLDVCAILGNNCQEFFDNMLSLNNDYNELAWWMNGFNKFRNMIEFIPMGYFHHKPF